MKIGIDISQIVYGTGVSLYTKNLVEHLLKIDRENEYRLFFSSLRGNLPVDFKIQNKKAKLIKLPIPVSILEPLWNKWHLFSIERFIGKVDVLHSSDWIQPPSSAARVTTIHDFGFLKFPDTAHPKIKKVMERRLFWVKKEIDMVIAVSEATKKDSLEILSLPSAKIQVVYEANPENLKKINDKKKIEKVLKKFKIKTPFVLSVATIEPRKNLKRLIQAFESLNDKNLSLVIVGKQGWGDLGPLNFKSSKIIFTDYVGQEEKAIFYSSALGLAFPSLYEGFGLPVLEAMSCGCPVLTSNVSSLPEVAGNAGLLVDPLSVKEIAKGLKEITTSKKVKADLIEKGFAQAKKFTWGKAASQTLEVYKKAYKEKFKK